MLDIAKRFTPSLLDPAPNPRAVIGGNAPPSSLTLADDTATDLSRWMADNPVVADEETARAAKLLVDRANDMLRLIETERDGLVRPLNAEVKAINDRYRGPRGSLERVRNALADRLTAFALKLEETRQRAADEARKAAEEAEAKARAAEAIEKEALDDASHGVCDIDIRALSDDADAAFAAFERSTRIAARAERDTKVRISGGFRKAMTLKNAETLIVADWRTAIEEMGLTDTIREAILTSARAYRKQFHELPAGITATFDRSL